MKEIDSPTWYNILENYKREHKQTVISLFLDDISKYIILKYILSDLYENTNTIEGIKEGIEKANEALTQEDLERMAASYEANPKEELLIYQKLKEYNAKNPKSKLAKKTCCIEKLITVVKMVKSYAYDYSDAELSAIFDDLEEELHISDDFLDDGDIFEEEEFLDDELFDDVDDFDDDIIEDMDEDLY
jgi:hypothetical protein